MHGRVPSPQEQFASQAAREASRLVTIPALTGIRGLAALLVVAYHFAYFTSPHASADHRLPGYLGVDLFFVLSGFVMALSYAKTFRFEFTPSAYFGFLGRRLARIYPVYILLTLLAFVLARRGLIWEGASITALLSSVPLLQNLGLGIFKAQAGVSTLGAAWSISTEMGAYLVFPALVALCVFRTWLLAILTAVAGMAVLVALVTLSPGSSGLLDNVNGTSLWPLARCLAEFCWGLVAWRVWAFTKVPDALPPWSGVIALLCTLCLTAVPGSDLAIVALLPFCIIQLATTSSMAARIFSPRPIFLLGEFSYSLYLIHGPSLSAMPHVTRRLEQMHVPYVGFFGALIVIAGDLLAAAFLFYFVEKPARKMLRRLFEHKRPAPISSEPAAP